MATGFEQFQNFNPGTIQAPGLPSFQQGLAGATAPAAPAMPASGGGGGMTPSGAAGIAGIATGIAGIASGIIGGGKRRREQRAAEAELKQRREAYETFEFKDPTAQMTNPFEDLTVNQQQAQFESQQQQQALASTLSGLGGAAGGSGVASLAQTLAQQQSQNLQRSAASIGQQEQRNQMAAAQGAQDLQSARAQGQLRKQEFELGRTETLLDMAGQRKAAADAARQQATQAIVGGIGQVASGVASAASGGVPMPF